MIISLPSTTATGNNNATLQLRGADNTAFKYMTFQRTGSNPYGHVLHILNGSNDNSFENCRMIGLPLTSANANAVNIWSDQGIDTGNVFMNNRVENGYFNVLYTGFSSSHENGTVFDGNVFSNAYSSSVQIDFNDNLVMTNNVFNDIRTATTNNADVSLLGCDGPINISHNYFMADSTGRALSMRECYANASNPSTIANNVFSRVHGVGILLDRVDYQRIVFNNINFTGHRSSNIGIETVNGPSKENIIMNNCIAMDSGRVMHIYGKAHVGKSDHNNFFSNDNNRFIFWNGKRYKDLKSFVQVSKTDSNSASVDPLYTSSKDLHVANPTLYDAGIAISGINVDFDGESRTSIPDIGADEFNIGPDDASMVAIVEPITDVCAGPQDVKVVIRNLGNNSLTAAGIGWELNGKAQTGTTWSGTLGNRETDTVTLGTVNFKGGASPSIRAWTTAPNGKTDGFPANDTFGISVDIFSLPFAYGGADKKLCAGDSVQLGIPGVAGNTFEWRDMSNNVIGTKSRVYVKPSATASYVFALTSTASGCTGLDTVEVVIVNYPVINTGADQVICEGTRLQIGSSAVTDHDYSWTSKPSGFVSTSAQPSVRPTVTTTYILEQKVKGTKCSVTDSVTITVSPMPVAEITGDTSLCEGG